MSTRLVVALGLLAGIVTTVAAGTLVIAFGPEVPLFPTPAPTAGLATPAPSGDGTPPTIPGSTTTPTPSATAATASGTASGSPGGSGPAPGAPSFHVGEPAPPLLADQLGGGTIHLAMLRGHPVWIEFMATWCPSCRDEFPQMNGFAARYADQGLVVIAIDVREDEGAVAAFVNQLGPTFPIGLDPAGTAADAWKVVGLPTHFFVDAQGVVRDGAVGGIGPDVMAASLRTIMPGVEVTP